MTNEEKRIEGEALIREADRLTIEEVMTHDAVRTTPVRRNATA
jgi:hypothetical protein